MLAEADLFTPRQVKGAPHCLSNIQLIYRAAALEAIEVCGLAITWRDEASELMCPTQAHRYGSVWSSEEKTAPFWEAYKRIRQRDEDQERQRERI